MGTHAGIIHLNGKVYDAKTGHEVKHRQTHHQKSTKTHRTKHRSVDGFLKHPTKPHDQKKQHGSTHSAHHKPHKVRDGAKHTLHHKQQKSQTLMRNAVNRPAIAPLVTQNEITVPASPPETLPQQQPERIKRALAVPKSSLITKFAYPSERKGVKKDISHVPVAPAPKNQSKPHHHSESHAAMHTPSSAEKHFNKALEKADSHKHAARRKKEKKVARRLGMSARSFNTAAAALAIILLAGFFAYQNIPNISMQIASSRAGFAAKLPNYQPSGFALGGPIEYEAGKITVNFTSNTDDRNYSVSQQVSGWNSEALADNFLASQGKEFQTYQDKGRTIYLYDNSNATWVSGGVWYQVNGNEILSSDQLVRIANSL